MTKSLLFAFFVTASVAAVACSSSSDDGAASPADPATTDDASKAADASKDPARDAAHDPVTDAATIPDASSIDASLPPLPPAFQQCGTCLSMTCQPQIAACDADPYCVTLLQCGLTSGCLASDPSSCLETCATGLGLTPKQTLAETKLLEAIAASCTTCLAQCPKPDGGGDSGL